MSRAASNRSALLESSQWRARVAGNWCRCGQIGAWRGGRKSRREFEASSCAIIRFAVRLQAKFSPCIPIEPYLGSMRCCWLWAGCCQPHGRAALSHGNRTRRNSSRPRLRLRRPTRPLHSRQRNRLARRVRLPPRFLPTQKGRRGKYLKTRVPATRAAIAPQRFWFWA